MEGRATISAEILCSYAADAAREVPGVRDLVESHLPRHRGVRVVEDERGIAVELHVALDWGTSAPETGRALQRRVREYLLQMADLDPREVNVVIASIG